MFDRVVVVGAGVAGLAACWCAAQRGAELRLFDSGLGASCLGGGAVDDRPWEEVARASEVLQSAPNARSIPASVVDFSEALGVWRLAEVGRPLARLVTEAGRVRLARGCDRALLDLSTLSDGSRVLLPRVVRPEWDADSLARALASDAYCASRGLVFDPVRAKLLKLRREDQIAPAELAARHDEPERRAWLCQRLREMMDAAGGADAVLLGPWLGADASCAEQLSAELGVAVGETLSGVGSAAGMRFEGARERLLASLGVELERARVQRIRRSGDEIVLAVDDLGSVISDAVVLAVGGLASGGIVYHPAEQDAGSGIAPAARPSFELSVATSLPLGVHGQRLDVGGSIHGPALDEIAWPSDADPGFLESVGVLAEAGQAAPGIFAAGDVVADRPRTLLQAVFSGVRAGVRAAGEPGSILPA